MIPRRRIAGLLLVGAASSVAAQSATAPPSVPRLRTFVVRVYGEEPVTRFTLHIGADGRGELVGWFQPDPARPWPSPR